MVSRSEEIADNLRDHEMGAVISGICKSLEGLDGFTIKGIEIACGFDAGQGEPALMALLEVNAVKQLTRRKYRLRKAVPSALVRYERDR